MIKKSDLAIFRALRENGRMRLAAVSRRTKLPVSTIYDRLKQRIDGVIQQYTVLLDFAKLGYSIRVCFIIKVEKEDKQKLFQFLHYHTSINNLYKINHGFDFLCQGIFRTMQDAEQFVDNMENAYNVKKVEAYYILETGKQEGFMPEE